MARSFKKGKGRFYRGTRPKKAISIATFHEVYCNRCSCNYQVSAETNADQWLNRHHAHFNCVEAKQRRENPALKPSRKRSASNSGDGQHDCILVLDGKRQASEGRNQGLDSVQDDVDPAVDFDIDVPDINEVMEAEIYDEYNLSAERGFFATTFNADDVAQPVLHHRLEQCNFNTVHMEELESEKTPIPTMDTAIPSSTISTIQKQILSNLDVNKKFEVRTRKLSSVEGKRKLADLVDLYGWGLSAGVSERKGNELLQAIHRIMSRHNKTLPMGNTWKAVKLAIRRKCRGLFKFKEFSYALPVRFFGTSKMDGKAWLPVKAYGLDVAYVLGKALLDVDPDNFAQRPKTQTFLERPDLMNMLDEDGRSLVESLDVRDPALRIPIQDAKLSDFSTGSVFRRLCEDADQFPPVNGIKPIHICIAIFSDKSQATQTSSEQPVVFSILNCLGEEYKMLFAGYAPLTLPYSDEVRVRIDH